MWYLRGGQASLADMVPLDLRSALAGFDPTLPIERASTPPASWFVSTEFAELEQREIFERSWQPVARVDEFVAPGDYSSGCLGRNPWVVTLGQDGELRAFHNTCRHKGREVVQGAGRADELVCGYHAWSYDLEGCLRKAPRMAGIEEFDREAMSLPAMSLEVWGPWIFLNPDPLAPPLAASAGPLIDLLDRRGWRGLKFVERITWDIKSNWKVVVDNYLDGGYHIPHMHPSLDAQLDMDSYRTEIFESSSVQSSRSAEAADRRIDYEAGKRIGEEALYLWLFPNFMLNRYGSCLDTNLVIPQGPDRCRVIYDFFFEGGSSEAEPDFIEQSMIQSDITQREDIAICESVQVGLSSGSYDRGRYAPQVEMGEYHFHRLLAARLAAALDRS